MNTDLSKIKKILVTRTDRIGDVILSFPAIKAARKALPQATITIMTSPRAIELFRNNQDIDEVIVLDKNIEHKGIFGTIRLVEELREKKFDIALMLHSTKRVNLVCFLAGIPRRVGYARGKCDFLLTDRIPYLKKLGEKHESEYSLDVLRFLGIEAEHSIPELKVSKEDEVKAGDILGKLGIRKDDRFIILHPGASCISKMWPFEYFAQLGDNLIENIGMKVLINVSEEQSNLSERVARLMKTEPIVFCDTTPLGTLAALFKKAALMISNDSGPAHLAAAVGTPVISIFGRNQKGLSPTRWKPLGDKCIALHKDVGCIECLAHNCKKGFLCLKAITPEEVLEKAKALVTV